MYRVMAMPVVRISAHFPCARVMFALLDLFFRIHLLLQSLKSGRINFVLILIVMLTSYYTDF